MKVSQLMSGGVALATPDTIIREVVRLMSERKVGSIVLVKDEKVAGIVTDRDVINALANDVGMDLNKDPISKIMTRDVHFIGADAEVEKAVDVMVQYGIKKLPVIREDKIVGIITSTDIASNDSEVMTSFRKILYKLKRIRWTPGERNLPLR